MQTFSVDDDNQQTILAVLRKHLKDKPSWSTVRRMLKDRLIAIGGVLCLDESRRLSRGEVVTVAERSLPAPPDESKVNICFIDKHVVVVEKPAGMLTLRRKSEYSWPWEKRNLQPTLDECVPRIIASHAAKQKRQRRDHRKHPKLFPVHRLDRDSSGLLVFARDSQSQQAIIEQFANRSAVRKYLALIPGAMEDQTIRSQFIRDRGDGLRGSTTDTSIGEPAVTHFSTLRKFKDFSELSCRLETGRTNQIRIHLAESGHPICGDPKYRGPFASPPIVDSSGIQRMALHATELKFQHPESGHALNYSSPWSIDIVRFIEQLPS